MDNKTTTRARDKDATRAVILAAAKTVLAGKGFQGFGVNAIAREAGCDKQLIYRYFGGLDGLLAAIGEDIADWVIDAADGEDAPATTYGGLMAKLAIRYLRALRGNLLMQKIVAWEVSAPAAQLSPLSAARARGLMAAMKAWRGDLTPPEGVDAPVVNAMIIGGVQQLVLASAAAGGFMGVTMANDGDWVRVEAGVTALINGLYGVRS